MSPQTATATRPARRALSPTRAAQRQAAGLAASLRKIEADEAKAAAPTQSAKSATKASTSRKATTSKTSSKAKPARNAKATATRKPTPANGKVVVVGFDFGTNTSCVQAGIEGEKQPGFQSVLPTVVGYADEGILDGILPSEERTLFGGSAIQHKLHLNLETPLRDGVVADLDAARDYCQHIRDLVTDNGAEVRAVIGIPANATEKAREDLRQAVTGIFERVMLVPEPFLAALGIRADSKVGRSDYIDPVKNSLVVDIGAGTTDICLVQGYFPTADDQISFPVAGDTVDQWLADALAQSYPDTGISSHKIREIKETFSYVGDARPGCEVRIVVNGKGRSIDVGVFVGEACNRLLDEVHDKVKEMIARAPSDGVEETLQNIILTGGGSCIKGFDTALQNRLKKEGYEKPKVITAGKRYKEYVALGAWKAARNARDSQWQHLVT